MRARDGGGPVARAGGRRTHGRVLVHFRGPEERMVESVAMNDEGVHDTRKYRKTRMGQVGAHDGDLERC